MEKNEKDFQNELNENIEMDDDIEMNEEESDFDIMFKETANKHKLEGTHALKRDTIFMGKVEEKNELDEFGEFEPHSIDDYDSENYNIQKGSSYELESRYHEDYQYQKNLIKDVYELLKEKTEIDFIASRRKPNKDKFNEYFDMCVDELKLKYTKSEIFVELTVYFTDNIFNMFKLLNKKNAGSIINELKEKGLLEDIGNIKFI